jgi:hypothetical protein
MSRVVDRDKQSQSHVYLYIGDCCVAVRRHYLFSLRPSLATLCPSLSIVMAPKPASTAGKAPASSGTASKAPAKTTEGSKAAKKTSKTAATASTGDETKKKRRKVRKETYSSYIYKGACDHIYLESNLLKMEQYLSKYILIRVSRTRRWLS